MAALTWEKGIYAGPSSASQGRGIRLVKRRRLADRRKLVGYSQERLSAVLGVGRSTVVRWESGDTVPQPHLRRKLAHALRLSLAELHALLADAAGHEETFALPASGRASSPVRWSSNSDDLSAMDAFRAADLKVGGGYLYASVVAYLQDHVGPRLFGATSGPPGRSVFTAAAALTELAGWMAHDAGTDTVAMAHLRRARDLVEVGGDVQLSSDILASMSHLSLELDRPNDAIGLATVGREQLSRSGGQRQLEARLLAMQARGFAAIGQGRTSQQLIDLAETLLADASPNEKSPWISSFDSGSLAAEAARCTRQLRDWDGVRRHAERIVALRPASRIRARAFGQLMLVAALVAKRSPDEAAAIAQEVLTTTRGIASSLVTQQLIGLGRVFQPYQRNTAVAEFLARLSSTLDGTMAGGAVRDV